MTKNKDPFRRQVAPGISILALTVTAGLFVFASLFLGEALGFYVLFWWWDDMLHFTSGIILALASILIIYSIDPPHAGRISPLFTALFAFCFAISLGAIWEIQEFGFDSILGWNAQRWTTPPTFFLLGREIQGFGLRDTMSDILYNTLGALVASSYLYIRTKKQRSQPNE